MFNIVSVLNNEISSPDLGGGGGIAGTTASVEEGGKGEKRRDKSDKLVPCVFAQPRRIMYTARR